MPVPPSDSSRGRFLRVLLCFGLLLVALGASTLRATSVVPPEFEELVRESDYVVRGRITEVDSAWEERGQSRVIVTHVQVEVLEVIAGEPPTPLVLTMLGGKVGEKAMVLEGAPTFTVGEEDILFVQGNGRQVSPLTRMMHGRYRVMKDTATGRAYVSRNNREPLTQTSEVAQPLHAHEDHGHEEDGHEEEPAAVRISRALSPDDFVSRIRAVKPIKPRTQDLP